MAGQSTKACLGVGLILALALGGCSFGGKKNKTVDDGSRVYAMGVNGYLWRAALDTLAFLPMAQVNADNGVLISDWYINPDAPEERIKVSTFILDRALRADALKVTVSREVHQNGNWVAAPVKAGTVEKLENAVLNRARELRLAAGDNEQ